MSKKKANPKNSPPMLPERQSFLKKLRNRVTSPLVGFGKIALFTAAFVLVISSALTGTDMLLHGRVMPRTTFGDADLSLASTADARTILQQTAEKYLKTPLTFAVNNTQAQITPEQLGVQFSLTQNTAYVPTYDLHHDTFLSLLAATIFPHKLTPFLTYDSEKAQQVIEEKLELKNLRAKNASIDLNQKNPNVTPEASGQVLSKNELITQLNDSIANVKTATINLILTPENPLITAQNLEPQKKLLASLSKTPLTLSYEGRIWRFDPSKNLDAIAITQTPTVTIKNLNLTLPLAFTGTTSQNENLAISPNPSLTLSEEKLRDYLHEIVAKIERPTADVKIYTDANQKIIIDGKGQNGIKVAPSTLVASLDLALNNNIKKVPVPAVEMPANVTVSQDLQDRGIKNLIATGHSAFAGSHPGRIKNINVGINKYNGLLVKQGDTFSFNDHLGPVDGEHGFVEELVIKSEGTVPEFGGGLCQVSSTLYRAALFAGFPIVERAAHKYAVSYYAQVLGYGLDATIYPGVHDVKFKNDSPSDILIQAYTDGDQAYFKFYGTDDGRKVKLEGPYLGNYVAPGATEIIQDPKLAPGTKKQVENNHTGFDSTWYRYIVKDDKESKETLFTRYAAIPAKIKVGAGGTDLSTGA